MAYKIEASGSLRVRVAVLNEEANASGEGTKFTTGLRSLLDRLGGNPLEVGEIHYRLTLGEPVHHAVAGSASLYFAVYEQHQIVWITRIDRLLNSSE